MEKRFAALEKRIAKLEKAAVLFEQHRQAWIDLNEKLKIMNRELDADARRGRGQSRSP